MSNQVHVINPESGEETAVSAKAFALIYQQQGFTLVDPGAYTPPPPPVMPPAQNDHMGEDILTAYDAKPLEPVQTAGKRRK